jgi:GNAT superfamily N-acetyltransferase
VELVSAPDGAWLAMVAEHKGALPAAALHVLTRVPVVVFAQVRDADGGLLAVARGTVTGGTGTAGTGAGADRWLGVTLMQVAPRARRQGLAGHVMRELAAWGSRAGATRAFLQVEERNTAATALYGRLGFHTHHTYLTRRCPAS